jgi:hypothetical protein
MFISWFQKTWNFSNTAVRNSDVTCNKYSNLYRNSIPWAYSIILLTIHEQLISTCKFLPIPISIITARVGRQIKEPYFNDQDLVGAVPNILVLRAVCEASLVFAECSTESTQPVIWLIFSPQRPYSTPRLEWSETSAP